MAVSISGKNYASIDTCESIAAWTGNKVALVPDYFKQGSNSVGFTFSATGNNDAYVTGSWNLSTTPHLRMWLMTVVLKEMESDANGGIQLYCTGGGNTGYWKISGKDSYPGGWYNLVIDLNSTVDSGSQPTLSSVTVIGLRIVTNDSAKNAQNTWVDSVICCDGLIAKGDDSGGYFDLDDVYALDNDPTTGGFGVIRKIGGQFFAAGMLEIGDSGADILTKFNPKSSVLVFEDRRVNTSLYKLNIVDYGGTNATEFILGSKSGSSGIEGCIVRVEDIAQTAKFSVVGNNSNVDNFKIYGSTFLGSSGLSFPPTAVNVAVLTSNFEVCGKVVPNTCKVQYCKFVSPVSIGIEIDSTSNNVTDCEFIGGAYGTEVSTAETYPWTNMTYSGTTTADIHNTSGGLVTLNCDDDSNPITYTGNTDIKKVKTLLVKCKNESGLPVGGVRVRIENLSTGVLISNGETDSSGEYEDATYNYSIDVDVKIIARLKGYKNNAAEDTILTTGLSVPFTMSKDPTVNLP